MSDIANTALKFNAVVDNQQSFIVEQRDWWAGTPTGGPNGDGVFPLSDWYGNISNVASPAAIEARANSVIINTISGLASKVSKTGDTMTGPLVFQPSANATLTLQAAVAGTAGVPAGANGLTTSLVLSRPDGVKSISYLQRETGSAGYTARHDHIWSANGIDTMKLAEVGSLSIHPTTNPQFANAVTQVILGESTNNPDYSLRMGYAQTTSAFVGGIDAVAGGVGGRLDLNPSGGPIAAGGSFSSPAEITANSGTRIGNFYSSYGLYRNGTLDVRADAGDLTLQPQTGSLIIKQASANTVVISNTGNMLLSGALSLAVAHTHTILPTIKGVEFGYASGGAYSANLLQGDAISLHVDVSTVAGGNFQGSGIELVVPRTFQMIIPNAAGTDFEPALKLNGNTVTLPGTLSIQGGSALLQQAGGVPAIGLLRTGITQWNIGGNGTSDNTFNIGFNSTKMLQMDSGQASTFFTTVNSQMAADGIGLGVLSSYTGNHNIIEAGQTGSDGYLKVNSALGANNVYLSGYAGAPSYFLNHVGIGTASPTSQLHVTETSSTACYTTVGNGNNGIQVGVNAAGGGIISTYSGNPGISFGHDNAHTFVTDMTLQGPALVMGTASATSTARKTIEFAYGGYGQPAAFGAASDGDKLILFSDGSSYDGRFGAGSYDNLTAKSAGSIGGGGIHEWYCGGTGSPTLMMWVRADGLRVNGPIYPVTDGTYNLGASGNRFATVFATTSSINTSDATEKNWLQTGFSEAELAAARDIQREIGSYQWLSSIAEKGADKARIHYGVRSQNIAAIAQTHGLDPSRYGWFCHDKWDAVEAVTDGSKQNPNDVRQAGELYGIRVDELQFWLIAANDARLTAIEAKLAA